MRLAHELAPITREHYAFMHQSLVTANLPWEIKLSILLCVGRGALVLQAAEECKAFEFS